MYGTVTAELVPKSTNVAHFRPDVPGQMVMSGRYVNLPNHGVLGKKHKKQMVK